VGSTGAGAVVAGPAVSTQTQRAEHAVHGARRQTCSSVLTRATCTRTQRSLRTTHEHSTVVVITNYRWLKCKFWGPGTLKKFGPYCKLKAGA